MKNQPSKMVENLLGKLRKLYMNVIFSCPQIIEYSRQYLLLRTVVLQKPVVGCSSFASIRDLGCWFYLPNIIHCHTMFH